MEFLNLAKRVGYIIILIHGMTSTKCHFTHALDFHLRIINDETQRES